MASNTTEPDSDDSFYKSRRKTRRRRVSSVSSDDSVIARPHRRKKCRVSSSSSDSDDSLLARPSRKKCKVLSESESDSTLTSDSEEEILQRNQRRPQRNVVVSDSEGTSPEKSSPVAINSVTADLNSSDSDEGEKCIICFKSLKPPFGNPSNCSHHFHPKCLATWSKTSNTCPIDRVKYTAIHVVDSRGDLVSREAVTTPPPQDHNADFEPDDATFCEVCSQHDREHEMLLCDRCEAGYHLDCLTPPLREVPDGNWFCPICTELGNELAAEMNVLMDDAAIILESRMRQRSSTSTRMPSRPRTRGAQRVFNIIHHQQSADQPSTSSVTIRRQRASSHRVRRSKSRRPQSTRYKVELITVEDGTTLEVKVAVNTRTRTKSKKHSRRKSKKKCSKSHRSDGPSTSRDAIFTGEGPSRPLDLFGSRPQLDYFSGCEAEDELDEDGGRGGGVVALRCPRPGVRNMASRKQIAAQILNSRPRRPAPTRIEVSRAPVDLVSSIIEQQEKWHSPGASYQSTSNGDIRVIMKESRTSRIRQAGGSGEGSSNNAPSTSAQTFSSSSQPTRDAGSSGSGSASGSQGTSNAPQPSSSSSSRTCGDGDLSKSSGSSERVPSPKIPSSSAMDKEEKDADEDSLCVKSRGKLEPDSPSKPSHHNPNVLETDEEEINKRVGYGKSTSDIHSPSQCLRSAEQYEVPPRSPSVEESNSIQGIQSRMSEENAVSGNDSEHSNDDEAPLADIGSVTDSPSGDQRVPEDLSMKKTCDSKENTVSNTKKGNCLNVASKTIDKVDCDKQDAAPEQERIINEEDAFDEKPEDLSMVESGVLEKNETDEPGHVVKEEFKSQQDDSNLSDPVSAVVRESVDEVQSAEYNADDVDIQEIDRQSECDNEDFPTKNYTDVENLTNKRDVEESTETEASLDDDSSVKARDDVKDELQDVDAEIKDNDVGDTEDDSKHSVNDGKVNLSQDDAGGRSVDDDTEDVDANDSSVTLSRDDVGVKDVDGNTDCDDADVGAYGKVRLINDNNVNFAQVGVTDGEDVTNAVADYVKLKDDVDAGVTDDDNGVDVKAVVDGVKLKEDVDADVKDDANAVDVKLKEDVDADVKDDDNAVDVKLKDDVDPNVKDDGMGVDVKLKDDVDADVKDDDMVADVKLKDDVDADLKDDDNGTDVGDGSNVPCINDSNANSECATVDSEVSNEKVPTTHDISSCLTAAGKDEGLNDKNSLLDSNLSELSDGELADEFNEERPSISSSTNNANLDDQLSKFGPSSAEIGGYQLQCSNNENQEIPNLMTDSKHEDPAHKSLEDKSGMDSCKKELNCENEQEAHGENGDLLEIGCEEEKDGLVDITDEEISNYERSWEMEENGEKTKKEGLEGLETEAISDCDSQSVDPEVPQRKESEEVLEFQPINQVTEETSKEEEGEIVTEEGSPVQKNKTLKERNYRGDMKKKDSAQNNDKQSEPERYEARRVIMEKPHKKGERRDVSSDSESTSLSSSIGRSISREKMSRSKSRSRSRGRVKDKRARDRSREHSKSRSRERNKVRSVSREKNRRNRSRDRQSRSRSRKRRRSRTPRRDRGRSRERSSRERRKRKRSLSSSCSSCSCSSCEREKKRNKKLTVIVPNEGKNRERSRDRGKNKKDKRRRSRSRNRKRKTPVPSKEVFTSGNNILVSVNFKSSKAAEESARGTETAPTSKRKKDDEARKKKDKRTKENQPMRSIVTKKNTSRRRKINTSNMKPVAIIDLDASPFRETTLSPKEIIILTDSDDEDKLPRTEPAMQMSGPKTPPEPHIKFSIANNSKQQQQLRGLPNPLMDKAGREDDDVMHIGPNTPPEPSAAYDPFEPTKSRSPSPGPTSRSDRIPSPPSDAKQRHSPLQSQISMTPPKLSQHDSPKTPSPLQSMPKDMDDLPDKNKQPPFQPTGLDSGDDSGGGGGGDSPYSPGSSEGDDLFEPPMPQSASVPKPRPRPMAASQSNKSKPPPPKVTINTQKRSNIVSKEPSKKGPARKDMGLKLDEDQLKILDDLPNSAVEMQFLKKLNRQERVVEEVKLVLKPHYAKKHVSKEEYKEILRRSVPKICHSRSGEINPMKIQRLVEAYVKKYRHRMKRKGVAPAIAPLRQNKPVVVKNQWA